jgi:hypothetical protein
VDADQERQRPRLLAAVLDPAVVVLFLAGCVDLVAGDPLSHGLVLVAVAAVLVADGRRRRPDRPRAGSPALVLERVPAPLLAAAGLADAWVAGGLARFTWPATVAVAGPGLAAMAMTWRHPPAEDGDRVRVHPLGLAAWAAVFVALALLELAALLLQPSLTVGSQAHPTISVLVEPLLAGHLGRSTGLALWLAAGWYLVRL